MLEKKEQKNNCLNTFGSGKMKIVQENAGILIFIHLFVYLIYFIFVLFYFIIIINLVFAEAHPIKYIKSCRGHLKSIQIPRSIVISEKRNYPSRSSTNHRKRAVIDGGLCE